MVKWTKPARDDLKEIHDFIRKDSLFYAKKVVDEITNKVKTLTDFPMMGRVVPEIATNNNRE